MQPWHPVIFSVSFPPWLPSSFMLSLLYFFSSWLLYIIQIFENRYKQLKNNINFCLFLHKDFFHFYLIRIIFNRKKMYWDKTLNITQWICLLGFALNSGLVEWNWISNVCFKVHLCLKDLFPSRTSKFTQDISLRQLPTLAIGACQTFFK